MKQIIIPFLLVIVLVVSSCSRPASGLAPQGDSTATAQASEYYTCPMHPQVQSDKPGSCPICHMDLVKASGNDGKRATDTSAITVNERGQQLANSATVAVCLEPIEHMVHAFGTLEIPEPNKSMISARFSGRIEKLFVTAVGTSIKKGQPLFTIYSPDLVQAEHEYLQALKTGDATSERNELADIQPDSIGVRKPMTLLAAARSKLELFGFTLEQIRTLASTTQAPFVFTYHSPAAGIVVEKKIVEGMYVSEGLTLFELSDLSTLWNIADVYEEDASRLHVGDKAAIRLQSISDRTFPTAISFIYPLVNPQSRTVKVRMTVDNASGVLRPNAYTETIFKQSRGMGLTVPVTAVLITGKRNIVYVKTSEDRFEQREVGLGIRMDGKYEITHGLRQGDTVVSEGGYLIDSESQLKNGNGY